MGNDHLTYPCPVNAERRTDLAVAHAGGRHVEDYFVKLLLVRVLADRSHVSGDQNHKSPRLTRKRNEAPQVHLIGTDLNALNDGRPLRWPFRFPCQSLLCVLPAVSLD